MQENNSENVISMQEEEKEINLSLDLDTFKKNIKEFQKHLLTNCNTLSPTEIKTKYEEILDANYIFFRKEYLKFKNYFDKYDSSHIQWNNFVEGYKDFKNKIIQSYKNLEKNIDIELNKYQIETIINNEQILLPIKTWILNDWKKVINSQLAEKIILATDEEYKKKIKELVILRQKQLDLYFIIISTNKSIGNYLNNLCTFFFFPWLRKWENNNNQIKTISKFILDNNIEIENFAKEQLNSNAIITTEKVEEFNFFYQEYFNDFINIYIVLFFTKKMDSIESDKNSQLQKVNFMLSKSENITNIELKKSMIGDIMQEKQLINKICQNKKDLSSSFQTFFLELINLQTKPEESVLKQFSDFIFENKKKSFKLPQQVITFKNNIDEKQQLIKDLEEKLKNFQELIARYKTMLLIPKEKNNISPSFTSTKTKHSVSTVISPVRKTNRKSKEEINLFSIIYQFFISLFKR